MQQVFYHKKDIFRFGSGSNWKKLRLKYGVSLNMGQSPKSEDCNTDNIGLPFLQGNAEFGDYNPKARLFCETPPKVCNKGEILLSVRAPVGAINFADQQYGIGRGLCAIFPERWTLRYFYYALHAVRKELMASSIGSTFDAVSLIQIQNLILPLPPRSIQSNIADFLDARTSIINALVEEEMALLSSLQEYRQALITQATTKGLDPNVAMKNSGVEWLGEVPEHWETKKLKYVVNLITQKAPSEDRPYVGLEHIKSETGHLLDITNDEEVGSTSILFEKYDVLFGKLRPYLAKCYLATFSGRCSSEFFVLRTGANLHSKYLCFFILTSKFIDIVNSSTFGTKMPRVNWEYVGNLPIPIPPFEEQKKIVNYLESCTKNLDILTDKVQKQIALLHEYRESLIYHAVTGKIDVRGEA